MNFKKIADTRRCFADELWQISHSYTNYITQNSQNNANKKTEGVKNQFN